jgi:hypothetical protein
MENICSGLHLDASFAEQQSLERNVEFCLKFCLGKERAIFTPFIYGRL